MSLYERLCKRGDDGLWREDISGISIDQFSAMLIENTYGNVTRQQIIDDIGMDAAEIAQLDAILARGANAAAKRELYIRVRSLLHLAESDFPGYGRPSQLEALILSI